MVKQTSGPLKPNAGLLMTALIESKDPGELLGSSGALQIVDPTVAACESAEALKRTRAIQSLRVAIA